MTSDAETQRLRELHELYVWHVNAAVAEGRDDLVAELADEYLDEALALLAASRPPDRPSDGLSDRPSDAVRRALPAELAGLADVGPAPATTAGWEVVDCRPRRDPWWRRVLGGSAGRSHPRSHRPG